MPSYVDFSTSKNFRDFLITKTLTAPNGPQTFTATNYSVNNLNAFANIDTGTVDSNRSNDLLQSQNSNVFKPLEYSVNENFNTIARKANLNLYPYFVGGQDHNLIGIMNTTNYDTESELFKFAAWNIQNNSQGPFFARLQQNLYSSTVGKVRLIDALEGNMATAINLLTGKEPLIETNPRITVAKTIPGKAIDFLQTVAGVEFPWTEIPGDYLSNPVNPTVVRPTATTEIGKTLQDITGVIGSLFGIQRRPTITRKPSDLFIEYMGERQKSTLFDNLSYSKYAPDYTTTARSQNTSKLFNFVDKFAQGAKNFLGIEAPKGVAYIGDDRGNDVKYAMNDFNDRPVKSSYYLGIMFDPIQARLFQRIKNIGEGGGISGKLTWISSLSRNIIGKNNSEFSSERSQFEESLSTNQTFRDDSILGLTQEILETMPTDGGAARSHVANVIDQTSRIFRDGDVMMSKGSGIKYVNQFTQQESGVEYCRVWTKDRSYMNNSDTMKRTGTNRKFESSVLSAPWNLNIYPNSNGNGGFDTGSTNIARKGNGFYAKKYMFSLENLAWKLSNNPGFTYNDLPYCERGPNGGRIMWFPPYDLKISEQNAAKWEENVFLGRPEPVYTYQNTSRAGQVSFKVIVDHPSILNLLVKDHFKGMSDEEADNYINAFFAGCEDVDFYGLIRKYTTLTPNDVEAIKAYLNESKDPKTVTRHQSLLIPPSDKVVPKNNPQPVVIPGTLYFKNDYPLAPSPGLPSSLYTDKDYQKLYDEYISTKTEYLALLTKGLDKIKNQPEEQWTDDFKNDYELLTNIPAPSKPSTEAMDTMVTGVNAKIEEGFNKLITSYNTFTTGLLTLKTALSDNKVQNIIVRIQSSTSSIADAKYNLKLSYRRSYSIILDIINKIIKDGYNTSEAIAKIVWSDVSETDVAKIEQPITIPLKYFGYSQNEGNFVIEFVGNIGEQKSGDGLSSVDNVDCSDNNAILTSSELKMTAPITFCCRKSVVGIQYTPQDPDTEISQPPVAKRKLVEETDTPTGVYQTPPIDEIKKIIMRTLSECYYFKKLEEESPIQFSSLREKLRYFHPAFHSMTPEGLNARLTFLNQCVRPGDTLPIRGLSDESDLNARNTTFGPPPICVLRIGDFYHSKIIIRDVNITFEDNVWDLNPEGIGVQPMIANVQLQVNFIGGHGLEKPVERLQNALSSNFYANTEMYDPRSTATEDRTQFYKQNFTKEFLDSINKEVNLSVTANPKDALATTDTVIQGSYIGTPGNSLDYSKFIDKSNESVYYLTESYFDVFRSNYDKVIKTYGTKIASMVLSPYYRTIHDYTVQTGAGTETIELLGNYQRGYELERILSNFKIVISGKTASENITSLMGFSNSMTSGVAARSETLLNPYVLKTICKIIDDIPIDIVYMSILERKRNELIKTLDKLNFIIEYGYDGKVEKNVYTGANFTGYTYDIFYGAYSSAISFIKENHSKFSEDLDTTYDFNGTTMTTDDLYYFLSILLRDYRKEILDLYTKDSIFTTKIQRNIEKKLDLFLTTEPQSKNFGITRYPIRKNENKLLFGTTTEFTITDDVIKQKILNTHKTKGNLTTTTLNYYRSVYGTSG